MTRFCVAGQGGGCASAYHAGVIKGLRERFGLETLGRVVGSSGLILNWSYVISGQPDLIIPIWEFLFQSEKFITPFKNPTGRGVMDINFLVDQVIYQGKFALDLDALHQSIVRMEIGATDARTGESIFFSKRNKASFYELLRDTCMVPYFGNGKPGQIDDCPYYDGTIGSVLGLERVQHEPHLLIILTRPYRPVARMIITRKLLRWLLLRNEFRDLQEAIWSMPVRYNQALEQIREMMHKQDIAVICPDKKLPIWRIDTSLSRLRKTIEQGYEDTMRHKGLERFFARL